MAVSRHRLQLNIVEALPRIFACSWLKCPKSKVQAAKSDWLWTLDIGLWTNQKAHRPDAKMLVKNDKYRIDQIVITANHTRLAASMAKRMKIGNIVSV